MIVKFDCVPAGVLLPVSVRLLELENVTVGDSVAATGKARTIFNVEAEAVETVTIEAFPLAEFMVNPVQAFEGQLSDPVTPVKVIVTVIPSTPRTALERVIVAPPNAGDDRNSKSNHFLIIE